ncbi:hypothetical protein ACFYPK_32870 [Streptomyces halstedii]|uniref:hypothetical protein n=1 Tax=Streptomyces halstedii TaxID=1944 RepID=UPI00345F425F
MSPRPAEEARTQLKREVTAAMKRREIRHKEADRIKQEADAEFWQSIDPLRNAYFGAQTDIAVITGFTRDHILKQSKRHRSSGSHREEETR